MKKLSSLLRLISAWRGTSSSGDRPAAAQCSSTHATNASTGRQSHPRLWLGDGLRDARYAFRMFRCIPAFSAVAVATLAIGIGAGTAIFSVINAVLLRPLPYPDADRLVRLVDPAIAVPEFQDLRSRTRTLSHVGVFLLIVRTMAGEGEAIRLEGARISPAILPMLGATPQLGRAFRSEEERAGADAVVLLSDATWRRRFQKDPHIVGRMVQLDGRRYEVVGVMPPDFALPGASTSFWVPFVLPSSGPALLSRYVPIARVRPDVSLQAAVAEINTILHGNSDSRSRGGQPPAAGTGRATRPGGLKGTPPPTPSARSDGTARDGASSRSGVQPVAVVRLQDRLVAPVRPALLMFSCAAGLVLLIACANVANLLLARSAVRQREFAIRLALGSGRSRLIRQLLSESLLVSLVGGLAGVGLAAGGVRLLRVLSTGLPRSDLGPSVALPRLDQVAIDSTALLFAVVAAVVTGFLVGLAPVLRHFRPWRVAESSASGDARQFEALRDGVAGHLTGGFDLLRRHRGRAVLIVLEIGIATEILITGGLLTRSLVNLLRVQPGYDASHVLTFTVARTPDTLAGDENHPRRAFAEALVGHLRTLPGVVAAGYAGTLPMVSFQGMSALRLTSVQPVREPTPPGPLDLPPPDFPNVQRVSEGFLTVMGIPILEGRGFDARDVAVAPRALLINSTLARSGFLGEHPIGRRVYMEDATPWEIVGVVGDVRQVGLDTEAGPQVFVDFRQAPGGTSDRAYFALRTEPGADRDSGTVTRLREAVRAVDPHASIDTVATMEQIVSHSVAKQRLYAILIVLFAIAAVLLASVGVFGIVAYAVTQRTREIGVRMALGASRHHVLRLVLGQSFWLVGEGLAAGLLGASVTTRLLSRWLFGVAPLDPVTFVAAAILFAIVAGTAAWLPARRAIHVDPLIALRTD
jgi:putative ABC transport system permease protein